MVVLVVVVVGDVASSRLFDVFPFGTVDPVVVDEDNSLVIADDAATFVLFTPTVSSHDAERRGVPVRHPLKSSSWDSL